MATPSSLSSAPAAVPVVPQQSTLPPARDAAAQDDMIARASGSVVVGVNGASSCLARRESLPPAVNGLILAIKQRIRAEGVAVAAQQLAWRQ